MFKLSTHSQRIGLISILVILATMFILFWDTNKTTPPQRVSSTTTGACPAPREFVQRVTAENIPPEAKEYPITIMEMRANEYAPPYLMALVSPHATVPCQGAWNLYITKENRGFAPTETAIINYLLGANGKCQAESIADRPLFVDVGANIGAFVGMVAAMGCRVAFFEPIPLLFRHVVYTVGLNGASHRTRGFNMATGSEPGKASFNMACSSMGLSGIDTPPSKEGNYTLQVEVARIDSVIQEDIHVLKMDTEGYEDYALPGMSNIFDKYNVENILIEIGWKIRTDAKVDLVNNLMDRGYKVFAFWETYQGPARTWADVLSYDKFVQVKNRPVRGRQLPYYDFWFAKNPPAEALAVPRYI